MTQEQGLLLSFSMYFVGAGLGVFTMSVIQQPIPRCGGAAFLVVCFAIAFWLSRHGLDAPVLDGASS
jgi:hypothetical protein